MAGAGLFREKSTAGWWVIIQTNKARVRSTEVTTLQYGSIPANFFFFF
jgi:hypothetical protein